MTVVARIRSGGSNGAEPSLRKDGEFVVSSAGAGARSKSYRYSEVHDPGTTNAEVSEATVPRIAAALVAGNDAVLLAIGATASGKTHTLYGADGLAPALCRALLAGGPFELSAVEVPIG